MMDWTDRHCRYFLRGFSPQLLLYTEMIVANAILRGDRQRLLRFHADEHPVALQLGGSDPEMLADAARIGADFGYDEINLNCGCPSDKVQTGAFGACLMREPERVARCVAAMRAALPSAVPVTVKLRIGTVVAAEVRAAGESPAEVAMRFDADDQRSLHHFVRLLGDAGCAVAIVHARKAVLGGWSPQQNREVPPLRYDVVREVRAAFPHMAIVLNGGLRTPEQSVAALKEFDGVMLGREAYHRPMVLAELGNALYAAPIPCTQFMLARMAAYAERELANGERLSSITRHMLGLLAHQPNAREYRRLLSEGARSAAAGPELIRRAALLAAA